MSASRSEIVLLDEEGYLEEDELCLFPTLKSFVARGWEKSLELKPCFESIAFNNLGEKLHIIVSKVIEEIEN